MATDTPGKPDATPMMNGIGMTTAHLQVLRRLFPPPRRTEERERGSKANKAVPSQARNERRCLRNLYQR
ncbi:hypothetical protein JMJ77_0001599 [Colletotrichum scovillei]|uniref:Uncharacterized protein n=1 Tax=Colletotrichum scovillei TaxID=1209932 RepID=A0A9P7R9K9_9PEZI|nr:hypothetical protein JMJ77_0001599 [Colletotrichum scovillei]